MIPPWGRENTRTMKRFVKVVGLFATLILIASQANAQLVSERKITKDAKKQAKALVKEGWKVVPGQPSIDMQQLKASKMNNTMDDEFNSKYVMGSAQSVGPNYDAAKFQATELAKIDIAGKIESELAGIVKTSLGNTQLEAGQAAALVKSVGSYKNIVAAKLVNIISCIDMYKVDSRTGNTVVSIGLFYNKAEAVKTGIKEIREQLQNESEELAKELDSLLGLNK